MERHGRTWSQKASCLCLSIALYEGKIALGAAYVLIIYAPFTFRLTSPPERVRGTRNTLRLGVLWGPSLAAWP